MAAYWQYKVVADNMRWLNGMAICLIQLKNQLLEQLRQDERTNSRDYTIHKKETDKLVATIAESIKAVLKVINGQGREIAEHEWKTVITNITNLAKNGCSGPQKDSLRKAKRVRRTNQSCGWNQTARSRENILWRAI